MSKCDWEEIDYFSSYKEFERFLYWINDQIKKDIAKEVIVQSPYSGSFFTEKWFLHKNSSTIWRLVFPEIPFKGIFKLVSQEK